MNIGNLLYDYNPEIVPERGSLLVSEPMMEEAFFSRSVVMILDIDRGRGHLGLVMNKATHLTLRSLLPDWVGGADVPVFAAARSTRSVFSCSTLWVGSFRVLRK